MFIFETLTKKRLESIIQETFSTFGRISTSFLLDSIKFLGFYYATHSGLSITIEDLKVPRAKKSVLHDAHQKSDYTDEAWKNGYVSDTERLQRIIQIWTQSTEGLKNKIVKYYETFDPVNTLYVMAFSGARGSMAQVRQLIGMRGLMSDQSGRIIDLPIQKNFCEGLSAVDYIISSYGARKGIVDTALKTADSGYLTRRLIYLTQDLCIREIDCQTPVAIWTEVRPDTPPTKLVGRSISFLRDGTFPFPDRSHLLFTKQSKSNRSFRKRTSSKRIQSKLTQPSWITLDPPLISRLRKHLPYYVGLRSPLTCQSLGSICQVCYGWNLGENQMIELGETIGILAAQSIGEPGTQLTMRTFHTGGIFTSSVRHPLIVPFSGMLSVVEPADMPFDVLFEPTRTFDGQHVLKLTNPARFKIENWKNRLVEFVLTEGTSLYILPTGSVYEGQLMAEFIQEEEFEMKASEAIRTPYSGELIVETIPSFFLKLFLKQNESRTFLNTAALAKANNPIWLDSLTLDNDYSIDNLATKFIQSANQVPFAPTRTSLSIEKAIGVQFVVAPVSGFFMKEDEEFSLLNPYEILHIPFTAGPKSSSIQHCFIDVQPLVKSYQYVDRGTRLLAIRIVPCESAAILEHEAISDTSFSMVTESDVLRMYSEDVRPTFVPYRKKFEKGDSLTPILSVREGGRLFRQDQMQVVLQKSFGFFFAGSLSRTLLSRKSFHSHVSKPPQIWVPQGTAVGYSTSLTQQTSDIVQGLPKIEQLVEARVSINKAGCSQSPSVILLNDVFLSSTEHRNAFFYGGSLTPKSTDYSDSLGDKFRKMKVKIFRLQEILPLFEVLFKEPDSQRGARELIKPLATEPVEEWITAIKDRKQDDFGLLPLALREEFDENVNTDILKRFLYWIKVDRSRRLQHKKGQREVTWSHLPRNLDQLNEPSRQIKRDFPTLLWRFVPKRDPLDRRLLERFHALRWRLRPLWEEVIPDFMPKNQFVPRHFPAAWIEFFDALVAAEPSAPLMKTQSFISKDSKPSAYKDLRDKIRACIDPLRELNESLPKLKQELAKLQRKRWHAQMKARHVDFELWETHDLNVHDPDVQLWMELCLERTNLSIHCPEHRELWIKIMQTWRKTMQLLMKQIKSNLPTDYQTIEDLYNKIEDLEEQLQSMRPLANLIHVKIGSWLEAQKEETKKLKYSKKDKAIKAAAMKAWKDHKAQRKLYELTGKLSGKLYDSQGDLLEHFQCGTPFRLYISGLKRKEEQLWYSLLRPQKFQQSNETDKYADQIDSIRSRVDRLLQTIFQAKQFNEKKWEEVPRFFEQTQKYELELEKTKDRVAKLAQRVLDCRQPYQVFIDQKNIEILETCSKIKNARSRIKSIECFRMALNERRKMMKKHLNGGPFAKDELLYPPLQIDEKKFWKEKEEEEFFQGDRQQERLPYKDQLLLFEADYQKQRVQLLFEKDCPYLVPYPILKARQWFCYSHEWTSAFKNVPPLPNTILKTFHFYGKRIENEVKEELWNIVGPSVASHLGLNFDDLGQSEMKETAKSILLSLFHQKVEKRKDKQWLKQWKPLLALKETLLCTLKPSFKEIQRCATNRAVPEFEKIETVWKEVWDKIRLTEREIQFLYKKELKLQKKYKLDVLWLQKNRLPKAVKYAKRPLKSSARSVKPLISVLKQKVQARATLEDFLKFEKEVLLNDLEQYYNDLLKVGQECETKRPGRGILPELERLEEELNQRVKRFQTEFRFDEKTKGQKSGKKRVNLRKKSPSPIVFEKPAFFISQKTPYAITDWPSVELPFGTFVGIGEPVGKGSVDLNEVLAGFCSYHSQRDGTFTGMQRGLLKFQLILVNSIQAIYHSQGVVLATKHLELVVRQMTSDVQVKDPGQTPFMIGEMVDSALFYNTHLALKEPSQVKTRELFYQREQTREKLLSLVENYHYLKPLGLDLNLFRWAEQFPEGRFFTFSDFNFPYPWVPKKLTPQEQQEEKEKREQRLAYEISLAKHVYEEEEKINNTCERENAVKIQKEKISLRERVKMQEMAEKATTFNETLLIQRVLKKVDEMNAQEKEEEDLKKEVEKKERERIPSLWDHLSSATQRDLKASETYQYGRKDYLGRRVDLRNFDQEGVGDFSEADVWRGFNYYYQVEMRRHQRALSRYLDRFRYLYRKVQVEYYKADSDDEVEQELAEYQEIDPYFENQRRGFRVNDEVKRIIDEAEPFPKEIIDEMFAELVYRFDPDFDPDYDPDLFPTQKLYAKAVSKAHGREKDRVRREEKRAFGMFTPTRVDFPLEVGEQPFQFKDIQSKFGDVQEQIAMHLFQRRQVKAAYLKLKEQMDLLRERKKTAFQEQLAQRQDFAPPLPIRFSKPSRLDFPNFIPVVRSTTQKGFGKDGFLSAAGFQETRRILTKAAIEGKHDWLTGLKANVMAGKLIPAGSTFLLPKYRLDLLYKHTKLQKE